MAKKNSGQQPLLGLSATGTRLIWGDCVEVMRGMEEASVDAVVCDPPYGIQFMNCDFDRLGDGPGQQEWHQAWAVEALRVLKPGGHLVAAGGTRTYHRLACAVEDAGFEIRDTICWITGSGFPKSLDVSKKLKGFLPADAQCACDPVVTQIIQDSLDGHPSSYGSDGVQPHLGAEGVLVPSPLRDGSAVHSRVGQIVGVPGEAQANTSLDEDSDLLSSGDCLCEMEILSEDFQVSDSKSSDTPENTSHVSLTVPHKTEFHIRDIPDLVGDSVSFSDLRLRYSNIPLCPACGKFKVQHGLGTALKPAVEFFVLARKPLQGTVARNVIAHGVGALNIAGCRVETKDDLNGGAYCGEHREKTTEWQNADRSDGKGSGFRHGIGEYKQQDGRWPPNVLHDGSDAVVAGFPETSSGVLKAGTIRNHANQVYGKECSGIVGQPMTDHDTFGDSGSAARFFPAFPITEADACFYYTSKAGGAERAYDNKHPTVKPVDLMRWLVRLVTRKGGLVLDPFCGSGSTGVACGAEGLRFIGIERDRGYAEIAQRRLMLTEIEVGSGGDE